MIDFKLLTRADFEQYIEQVLQLFRLRFTAPVKKDDFIWRYLEAPYEDVTVVIALDGDMVVGFIGTMPNQVITRINTIKAAMITNIMTHPNYGGKGVFSRMLSLLEIALRSKGYQFLYTFPNYQSNHILVDRHDWKDIYEIPRLELTKEFACTNDESGDIVADVDFDINPPECYPFLGEKHIEHTVQYRKWRIQRNPSAEYDNFVLTSDGHWANAYITIKKYNDEYNIVDIAFENVDQVKLLLDKAISEFMKTNRRILTAWCPANTKLHTLFEKKGFINRYPITYFAGKCLSEEAVRLLDWDGWFIHPIDDNIY